MERGGQVDEGTWCQSQGEFVGKKREGEDLGSISSKRLSRGHSVDRRQRRLFGSRWLGCHQTLPSSASLTKEDGKIAVPVRNLRVVVAAIEADPEGGATSVGAAGIQDVDEGVHVLSGLSNN